MLIGELDSPDVEAKSFANHSILHKADTSDQNNPTSRAPGYSPPHLEERTPRKTLTVVNADGELEEVNFLINCRNIGTGYWVGWVGIWKSGHLSKL